MVREQNAMLTDTDREFLLAGGGYYTGENAKQMRYERRSNIRNRIRETLLDFTLLFEHLEERERAKIFEDADADLDNGVRDTLALLLYSLRVSAVMEGYAVGNVPELADALGGALDRAGLKDGWAVQDWDLEIEAIPISHLLRKAEESDELQARELGLLMETGVVSDDTQEAVRELVTEDLAGDGE